MAAQPRVLWSHVMDSTSILMILLVGGIAVFAGAISVQQKVSFMAFLGGWALALLLLETHTTKFRILFLVGLSFGALGYRLGEKITQQKTNGKTGEHI